MAIGGIVLGWVGMATLLLAILMGVYLWQNERDKQTSPEPVKSALLRYEDHLIGRGCRGLGEDGLEGCFFSTRGFLSRDGPDGGLGHHPPPTFRLHPMPRPLRPNPPHHPQH